MKKCPRCGSQNKGYKESNVTGMDQPKCPDCGFESNFWDGSE